MKRTISKSLLSVILVLALVISAVTVSVISASSARADLSSTGANEKMEVYFTKPNGWDQVMLHYWGGTTSSSWPGISMTKQGTNDFGQDVYYSTIPRDTQNILFHDGNNTQTVDIPVSKAVEAFYCNGTNDSGKLNVSAWGAIPEPLIPSGTEAPSTPPSTEYTVYFADCTDGRWIESDEAVIMVGSTALTKSIDEHTGRTVWYGTIAIADNSSITFNRVSKLDSTKVWNSWTGLFSANSPCYNATGYKDNTGLGHFGTAPTIPEGTATDYWYGIWADPKGDANVKDFIKLYSTNYNSSTDYFFYLPSYADRSALTIYTSLYDLKIGDVDVPRATATTVDLSASTYSISYKRYETETAHNNTLHVVSTTGTSALLLTTKVDLYANTTAAYAVKEDGRTPDFEMISEYKESTSTKGDYLCYDATGKLLNAKDKDTGEYLTGLKKIKGRGNSTFEASMRLYGKYAYNITLNDKAKLIDGCESSKKYSLLANNADETLMRNVLVYSIADTIKMPYTPNTRLVDMYDNGNYIGAYVLTEKVEYGKNTLIPDAKSLDKTNEDILAAGKGIDYDALEQKTDTYKAKSGTTYTYKYSYNPSGAAYEFDGTKVTIGEGEEAKEYTLDEEFMKGHDFLLEHEIDARYGREATWFISNRTKQAVVPKYPEFATQKEVQWMIEEYDALENAVYEGNYAKVYDIADVKTFADVYLIQELTMNLDAAATSYNILGGHTYNKLKAAPLWDYDWTSGQYNGKKMTVDDSVDVGDYNKVFVKNKSVKIEADDSRTQTTPNLQAKMTQMTDFWTVCKSEWTNKFVPVLGDFLGDGKTLLGTYLPAFRSAAAMNESRWHAMQKNYDGARSEDPMAATWGTRSTSGYVKDSNEFGIGTFVAGDLDSNYDSTVYFLNDWLLQRMNTMSTTMGLYDQSLIIPVETYLVGDVDDDKEITIMDASLIQRLLANYSYADAARMRIRGTILDATIGLQITDATIIQRYLADYTNAKIYGIEEEYRPYPAE